MTIKRLLSPVRSDQRLVYEVEGDIISVTHITEPTVNEGEDGESTIVPGIETTDVFDFSGFPDGEGDVSTIETDLPLNPFISVKRVAGVLEVEVLNFIGADATEEERFPQWETV